MKNISLLLVILTIVVISASVTNAENTSDLKREAAVHNLVKGINSENEGLRVSAASRISEFIDESYLNNTDASLAVIPLMKMLREGRTEMERIVAALSLYKIKDGRGIYLLRGTAKFDESSRVRKIGKNLYYNYHLTNGTTYFLDF